MRYSTDTDVSLFLECYDAVPERDRKSLGWEAIALAAGVNPTMLLGAAMVALQQHSVNTVRIIATSSHPDLTRRRVEFAQLPGGHHDRDALDKALGFLPSPKGQTFIINPGNSRKNVSDDEDEDAPTLEGDVDHLFPSPAEMQSKVQPLRSRLLGQGE